MDAGSGNMWDVSYKASNDVAYLPRWSAEYNPIADMPEQSALAAHYDRNNFAYAFLFYETGNVNAAIIGGGGYAAFAQGWSESFSGHEATVQEAVNFASQYPDGAAAVGIGAIVVAAPLLRKGAEGLGKISEKVKTCAVNSVDIGAVVTTATILGYTLSQDASFITQAACSFVLGSSTLHLSKNNPMLMKPAGDFFALGGCCFAAFGVTEGLELYTRPELVDAAVTVTQTTMDKVKEIGAGALPALSVLMGVYSAKAGLLTYEGGIYETMNYKDDSAKPRLNTLANKFFHPHEGIVSRGLKSVFDQPVQALNNAFKASTLSYIRKDIRENKPFKTSMYARLIWRPPAAAAAIAAGDGVAASHVLWGAGDHATGREDDNIERRTALATVEAISFNADMLNLKHAAYEIGDHDPALGQYIIDFDPFDRGEQNAESDPVPETG